MANKLIIQFRKKYLARVAPAPKKYKSLDEQVRDYRMNMGRVGSDFPLFNELRKGEIRLEELVNDYKEQFHSLLKVKKKRDELEREVTEYTKQVYGLISFFNGLSSKDIYAAEIDSYEKINDIRERKKASGILAGISTGCDTLYISGVIYYLVASLTFPYFLLPLYLAGLVALRLSKSKNPRELTKKIDSTFSVLRENAQYVDDFVEKIYVLDFFLSKPERFQEVYPALGPNHQAYVDRKLEDMLGLGMIDMNEIELAEFLEECRVKECMDAG